MRLTVQQFGGALVNALGVFAPKETAVGEEELQQNQRVGTQLAAHKEVRAQATIDVLDHRTGADHILGQFVHGRVQAVKVVAEFFAQCCFFLPTCRLALVESLQVEQSPDDGHGNLEVRRQ